MVAGGGAGLLNFLQGGGQPPTVNCPSANAGGHPWEEALSYTGNAEQQIAFDGNWESQASDTMRT